MNNFFYGVLTESFFNLILYLVSGITIFLLVWVALKNRWRWRRIQPKKENRMHFFRHDILFSSASVLMAGILTTLITLLDKIGCMKLYWEFNQYGMTWGILQFFFLIFFYDAYFYWTHRFMHHPKIFRWVHKTHHKNTDPSPLT
ncbi:MAG: sterol desaturase family protein, partial [Bacteroidota bacterium]